MTTYVTFNESNPAINPAQNVNDPSSWIPLLIRGNTIKFLHKSLGEQCEFRHRTSKNNKQLWRLTFFKDSPYVVSIDLSFFDEPLSTTCPPIGKAIWIQHDHSAHSQAEYQKSINQASKWLRDSSTLAENDFLKSSERHIAVDSKGIAFFAPANQFDTFLRCLVLQALAYAYQRAMADLSQQLARALGEVGATRKIYNKLIMFNALCFLSYPVDIDGIVLPSIWERLREKFKLERVNKELTRQAHDIAQLLAERAREDAALAREDAVQHALNRTASEHRRVKIIRFWGGAVSACLAVVSILQGLQAPPEELYRNFQLWKTLLF